MSHSRHARDSRPPSALSREDWSSPAFAGDANAKSLVSVLAAIAFAIFLAVEFEGGREATGTGESSKATATGPTLSESDPSYFLLNALLVPALDREALPLRWADPRSVADCGAGTTISVDGHPLVPGALVPVVPFEMAWDAHACRPFGPHGPRFDGAIRMTVFREDWGWSAMLEPAGMRIAMRDRTVPVTRAWATMPQWIDPEAAGGPDLSGD
jgi:hypothetical protein